MRKILNMEGLEDSESESNNETEDNNEITRADNEDDYEVIIYIDDMNTYFK